MTESESNWIRNHKKFRDFNATFPECYPGTVAGILFLLWLIVSLCN